jgi:CRISPR-associated protein Csb3
MAEATIPVDLFNPGQVFACLGFLEAADVLLGDAEGGFDWSSEAETQFVLHANGDANPFTYVLEFLAEAEVESLVPFNSELSTIKWQVPTKALPKAHPFPFPTPSSPATLPARVSRSTEQALEELVIDHWGDATQRDNVKFWAGAGGYPGAALFRDSLDLVRAALTDPTDDPFSIQRPQSSSFRLDWRRDYIPSEVGFSPNAHGSIEMMGYPIVEMMAAIGLSHARPRRFSKLAYGYAVLGQTDSTSVFAPSLLRAALGQVPLPFPRRTFRFNLGWPGKENQARCILDVTEELTP